MTISNSFPVFTDMILSWYTYSATGHANGRKVITNDRARSKVEHSIPNNYKKNKNNTIGNFLLIGKKQYPCDNTVYGV